MALIFGTFFSIVLSSISIASTALNKGAADECAGRRLKPWNSLLESYALNQGGRYSKRSFQLPKSPVTIDDRIMQFGQK